MASARLSERDFSLPSFERHLARAALRSPHIARLGKLLRRTSAPPTAAAWNQGYETRLTRHYGDLGEMAHHAVIAGYLARLAPTGSVLDIGCGTGVTAAMLRPWRRAYLGIDLSQVAVETARRMAAENERYEVADAVSFQPPARYDAIIFSESIEYIPDLASLMRRYAATALADGGMILVSMWLRLRSAHRWNEIDQVLHLADTTIVENQAGSAWVVRLFHARP
jgi:SAM-dependent methyltransferase